MAKAENNAPKDAGNEPAPVTAEQLAAVQAELATATTELATVKAELAKAVEDLAAGETLSGEQAETIKARDATIETLQADLAAAKDDLTKANADKTSLEAKVVQLTDDLAAAGKSTGVAPGIKTRLVTAIQSVGVAGGKVKTPGSEFELPEDAAAELVLAGAVVYLEDYAAYQAALAARAAAPTER